MHQVKCRYNFVLYFFSLICNRWNADEVGINFIDGQIKIATSRQNIHVELGDVGHLTLMLTTSASGTTGPPYFLFPEGVNSIPTSTIDDEDVVVYTKADA